MKEITEKAEQLEQFISRSPKWNGGDTYRGIALSSDELSDLLAKIEKSNYSMLGSSSWSSEKFVAEGYAKSSVKDSLKNGSNKDIPVVLISDKQTRGTSIRHLSKHEDEYEVLASKTSRYKLVEDIGFGSDGFYYIRVTLNN